MLLPVLFVVPLLWSGPLLAGEEVVVTATRTPQATADTLASVTVLEREEIAARPGLDVPGLLSGLAGVESFHSGGPGQNASLMLRGTDTGHVLVLVDGLRMGSATTGQFPWQDLPPEMIERIEVVRGPRSSLYGSDAIGGVVQVFTRQGREGLHARAGMGVGDRGTLTQSLALSGARGGSHGALSLSRFDTRGRDSHTPERDPWGVHDPDPDGYRNGAVSLRLGHRLTSGAELEGFAYHAAGENDFDSPWQSDPQKEESVQGNAGLKARFNPLAPWRVTLSVGQGRDSSRHYSADQLNAVFITDRQQAAWQNDWNWSKAQVTTLGADYQEDRVGGGDFARAERWNQGVFIQHQARWPRFELTAGGRLDDNESFGGETTGNLAVGLHLPWSLKLTAAHGTAFRAPSFNDLYFPEIAYVGRGNPNLGPEKSHSSEVGLEGPLPWGMWSVRGFYTEVDDLITWRETGTWFYEPFNVDHARIRGVEAEVSAAVGEWRAKAAGTLQDPEDVRTGLRLPYRAQGFARFDVDRKVGDKGTLGYTLHLQGDRFAGAEEQKRLGGYTTLDLRASRQLAKEWLLRGQVMDLFERGGRSVFDYTETGRRFLVTLEWQRDWLK